MTIKACDECLRIAASRDEAAMRRHHDDDHGTVTSCEHEWLLEGTIGERWYYCIHCKERVVEKP